MRVRCATADDGASAVEFALVLPILLLILFGIIDYGLWFEDSISLRQGVHDAARQAVVGNYGGGADTGCTGTASDQLRCLVHRDAAPATGTLFVQVESVAGTGAGVVGAADTTGTGAPASLVLVCAVVTDTGATGFVPLPRGGVIRARIDMRSELNGPAVGAISGADATPPGGWAWCDE